MSTEIVSYEDRLATMAKKAALTERPQTSGVGTRAGVLTLNSNPVPGNKLECIVIASTHANLFYEGKFDSNNLTNPSCFAYSEDGENMAPHPKSSKPQHTDCAGCPQNKWGSADTGKGKACKNVRVLGVIPADVAPADVATAELAVLKLPITSVNNFSQYVQKVSTLTNRPPLGVVTTIGTVPDAKSQFKVTFAMGDKVRDELIGPMLDRDCLADLQKVYEPNPDAPAESVKAKKF